MLLKTDQALDDVNIYKGDCYLILVVGGAGYIGSHIVKELVAKENVLVYDNLSTGHREAIDSKANFIYGDLGDKNKLEHLFSTYRVKAVIHVAAKSIVGESIIHPMQYYENNVVSTINLLNVMLKYDVKNIIFSSTAATYGIPNVYSIDESVMTNPINPYGKTKLMVERIIEDYALAYGLKYVILRYFNAAGADMNAEIGESHHPETHLIPLVLQHLAGEKESVSIYGYDYDTPDGTCVRDYIHVTDLAVAHLMALMSLMENKYDRRIYNLGNGLGYSVKEVITTCEEIAGIKAKIHMRERRSGDPPRLIASAEKIKKELGWTAERNLEQIIESAWRWHCKQAF